MGFSLAHRGLLAKLNALTGSIARFMGSTWGPSGADRTHVGPMLASRTLLSGTMFTKRGYTLHKEPAKEPPYLALLFKLHVCVFLWVFWRTMTVLYGVWLLALSDVTQLLNSRETFVCRYFIVILLLYGWLKLIQNDGRHFADDMFMCILIQVWLKFISKNSIENKSTLFRIMEYCRRGAFNCQSFWGADELFVGILATYF